MHTCTYIYICMGICICARMYFSLLWQTLIHLLGSRNVCPQSSINQLTYFGKTRLANTWAKCKRGQGHRDTALDLTATSVSTIGASKTLLCEQPCNSCAWRSHVTTELSPVRGTTQGTYTYTCKKESIKGLKKYRTHPIPTAMATMEDISMSYFLLPCCSQTTPKQPCSPPTTFRRSPRQLRPK